jgi:KamA family protein
MRVVSQVLPFRVSQHVVERLIDWNAVPNDPLFQLTFPQRDMLDAAHFDQIASALKRNAPQAELKSIASAIRSELNPHPAGQQEHNVPRLDGQPLPGLQHKYDQTVLFFPSQGQTCHSYCTFCFRWAQFIGDKELKFASSDAEQLQRYLLSQPQVSDLLITGGDPMIMKTSVLANYVEALLDPRLAHVQHIRFGSKALTFWPQRFVSDPDADDLLRLFETLVKAGKHVALMAHINHDQEIGPKICHQAIARIRNTGAVIRTQAPLLKHINDDPDIWARMWHKQVKLGLVPYYMFVERDTGARRYFELPLLKTWQIYREATKQVSGLARTARGPSMSAGPGKIEFQGVTTIRGEKVFALRFIQARQADWIHRPFFARFNPTATWLNHLKPAFGEDAFFFEAEYKKLTQAKSIA